jgi:hypothetical protein
VGAKARIAALACPCNDGGVERALGLPPRVLGERQLRCDESGADLLFVRRVPRAREGVDQLGTYGRLRPRAQRPGPEPEPERGASEGATQPSSLRRTLERGDESAQFAGSVLQVGLETAREDRQHPSRHRRRARNPGSQPLQRQAAGLRQRPQLVGLERSPAEQTLEQGDAEAEDIRARVDTASARLLRRHIRGRPGDRARIVDAGAGARRRGCDAALEVARGRPGQAKVDDTDPPVGSDEDVAGLDVAVHHPDLVGGSEAAGGVDVGREHLLPAALRAALPGGQGLAVDQLEGQEGRPVLLADLVDLHDIGMGQARERLRLTDQSLAVTRVAAALRCEHLERDQAVELGVPRRIDDAHAAGPDAVHELVAADANHRRFGAEQSGRDASAHGRLLVVIGPSGRMDKATRRGDRALFLWRR